MEAGSYGARLHVENACDVAERTAVVVVYLEERLLVVFQQGYGPPQVVDTHLVVKCLVNLSVGWQMRAMTRRWYRQYLSSINREQIAPPR